MSRREQVRFVEARGQGARERLVLQAQRWRAAGVDAWLLRSEDEDELWLLVGCGGDVPEPDDVAGAPTWRFRRADGEAP
jgi:hypothetical protein